MAVKTREVVQRWESIFCDGWECTQILEGSEGESAEDIRKDGGWFYTLEYGRGRDLCPACAVRENIPELPERQVVIREQLQRALEQHPDGATMEQLTHALKVRDYYVKKALKQLERRSSLEVVRRRAPHSRQYRYSLRNCG